MNADEVYRVAQRMIYEGDAHDVLINIIMIFENPRSDLDAIHPSNLVDDIYGTIKNAAKIEKVEF